MSLEEFRNEVLSLIKQYATAQHNRPVEFHAKSEDGWTAGIGNVYFEGYGIVFGHNSYQTPSDLYIFFKIPSDYVAGNIVFNFGYSVDVAGGTVDYSIRLQSISESGVWITRDTNAGQYTADATANDHNQESETLDGSAITIGDGARIRVRMEENTDTQAIYMREIEILLPVTGRD